MNQASGILNYMRGIFDVFFFNATKTTYMYDINLKIKRLGMVNQWENYPLTKGQGQIIPERWFHSSHGIQGTIPLLSDHN